MAIQVDNPLDAIDKAMFEQMLKRISLNAFNALIDCGVRDIKGFLRLTAEDMDRTGIARLEAAELLGVLQQIHEDVKKSRWEFSGDSVLHDPAAEEQQESAITSCTVAPIIGLGTPIPDDLLNKLTYFVRRILFREHIVTCEQLLKLQETHLFNIEKVRAKDVNDLLLLQRRIVRRHPELRHIVKNPVHYPDSHEEGCRLSAMESHEVPQLGQRSALDPADWSILAKTLPMAFHVDLSLLPGSDVISADEPPNIGCLGLTEKDIEGLRAITLFNEDPVESLFFCSIGYLLQASLSESALKVILEYLARLSDTANQSAMEFSIGELSDEAIFADTPISMIVKLLVPNVCFLPDQANAVGETTWRDISVLSERIIIERFGFTIQGLQAISRVWNLKEQALALARELSKGLPAEAYGSFEELVDGFIHIVAKNKRECNILKGRLGLLDGRKWTLEELGQVEQVTRERIRQIEDKRMLQLHRRSTIANLKLLWIAVDDILTSCGGVCCATDVVERLGNFWGWPTLPTDDALASIIAFSSNYRTELTPPIRFIKPSHPCTKCRSIGPVLIRTTEQWSGGRIPLTTAIEQMQLHCGSHCEFGIASIPSFSKGFLFHIADAEKQILADINAIYTQQAWAIQHGSLSALIEAIFLQAGRAMHFSEVLADVRTRRPDDVHTERNLNASIGRLPCLMLWDRGTYIHRSLVNIPDDFIGKIELNILERLQDDVPYVSVSGVFDKFEQPLISLGVPSECALYSCLRAMNHPKLALPEYPYLALSEKGNTRLPLQLVLSEFVNAEGGIVSNKMIRDFAVGRMCISEQLLGLYLNKMPHVLRINKGEYIHASQLNIQIDGIAPIVSHIEQILIAAKSVSVQRIFEDKRVTCKNLRISSPMLLYSVLEQRCDDRFDLANYPRIRRTLGDDLSASRSSIVSEIVDYVRAKNEPCSMTEVYAYFSDKLGYSYQSVNAAFDGTGVLQYASGAVVHFDILRWSSDKQRVLESLAGSHLQARESAGRPYGLTTNLYEYMHDRLPALPDQVLWTPALLAELLSRAGPYRLLGNQRNAFISTSNVHGIKSLDDLLYEILRTDYDGAANLEKFVKDMRLAGILQKRLTSSMLGDSGRVVIKGNVVSMAELLNHAS